MPPRARVPLMLWVTFMSSDMACFKGGHSFERRAGAKRLAGARETRLSSSLPPTHPLTVENFRKFAAVQNIMHTFLRSLGEVSPDFLVRAGTPGFADSGQRLWGEKCVQIF